MHCIVWRINRSFTEKEQQAVKRQPAEELGPLGISVSEEKLNKFSIIFLTKGNQNKAKQNSFKVKNICICFPLLSNFIGRGK